MKQQRLAIDVGGTFVDFVLFDETSGEVTIEKVPSSNLLEQRFFQGIDNLQVNLADIQTIIHGSTMVINTIVQEKGAHIGLITTKGFRDVLELGRGSRKEIYNLFYAPPRPLIERYLRLEVTERLDARGEVITPLNEDEARQIIEQLKAEGVDGVAICFLHAYANPDHEIRMAQLVQEVFPEAHVTISSEICQEWREFERTSTTVLNVYTKPKMANYLSALSQELDKRSYTGTLNIMQSSGGITSLLAAQVGPIRTVMSGPAGGVIGASAIGKMIEQNNLVAADVGGTTFDVALIIDGQPLEQIEASVNRRPVLQPTIDIVSIGAGGGSVAWLDDVGGLYVGPESVEADPGPACFDMGGTLPTVTDAQLLLGYLDPDYYLGERMRLNRDRAEEAIREKIAEPLGMSTLDAAAGIVHLANMNMTYAIRNITIERGHDPREFGLVCYGGGGGLFAGFLLNELGSKSTIIPPNPATFSAWGLLNADYREDLVRTLLIRFADITVDKLKQMLADLEAEARTQFHEYGIDTDQLRSEFYAAMRYVGQEHTVKVPILDNDLANSDLQTLRQRFDVLHEKAYALSMPNSATEIVNLQVSIMGVTNKPEMRRIPAQATDNAQKSKRLITVRGYDTPLEVNVYDRQKLIPGTRITGPAIIEEWTSTILMLPGQYLTVDDYGNLIMKVGE